MVLGEDRIPARDIASVDASRGRKRNWLKGLIVGLAIGVGSGFAFPVDPAAAAPTRCTTAPAARRSLRVRSCSAASQRSSRANAGYRSTVERTTGFRCPPRTDRRWVGFADGRRIRRGVLAMTHQPETLPRKARGLWRQVLVRYRRLLIEFRKWRPAAAQTSTTRGTAPRISSSGTAPRSASPAWARLMARRTYEPFLCRLRITG